MIKSCTQHREVRIPAPLLCLISFILLSLNCVGATLSVNVTDSDTGEPLEFVAVALTRANKNIGGLTDAEGKFLSLIHI